MILDCVGGSFWQQNVNCLAFEGTWINYGLLGGGKTSSLRNYLKKRNIYNHNSNDFEFKKMSEFAGNIEGNLLGPLLGKRCTLKTSTLKSRSDSYKAHLISEFSSKALPYFTKPAVVNGKELKMSAVVDKEFSLDSVAEAHTYVAQNKNIGKVLLVVKKDN